jgi:hypothetical protein
VTSSEWGRVGDDGTVYVKTADGERSVGQVPDVSPDEAMAFFTKRYEALAVEVDLLYRRVNSGVISPDEAASTVRTVRGQVAEANAVGDLSGLCAKLDELLPVIAAQRESRRAEKARRQGEAREEKEKLASGSCSTRGSSSRGSRRPRTTRCGSGSARRGRRTPRRARRTSPSRTRSATRRG